jgi:hypothetical protein
MSSPSKDPPAKEAPDGYIRGKVRAYFKQYGALKIASIVLVGYIALFSYTTVGTLGYAGGFVDPDVGYIIDANSPERTAAGVILTRTVERAIVAEKDFQTVCLGVTRVSAFFMYPCAYFKHIRRVRLTLSSHTVCPVVHSVGVRISHQVQGNHGVRQSHSPFPFFLFRPT